MKKYKCPCCGFLTFGEPLGDTYEICPVCAWEDDGYQLVNPESDGGANKVSLNQARKNFKKFCASYVDALKYTRKPKADEIPKEIRIGT